jgi:hypothetical protein
MEARLRNTYRWPSAVLLQGREFVKEEFRPVPAGFEEEAGRYSFLELRSAGEEEALEPDQIAAASADVQSDIAEALKRPAKELIADVLPLVESADELKVAKAFEEDGKKRVTVLKAIDERMAELSEAEVEEE